MAQPRSGPPPVPPRVDLGETEDTLPNSIANESPADFSEHPDTTALTENTSKDESCVISPIQPRSAPPKPVVASKPPPPPVTKFTKPSKPRDTKGRPEISIISACPMAQSNLTNPLDQRGIPAPQPTTTVNNNLFHKPVSPPTVTSAQSNAPETKRAIRPPPGPPKKSVPYGKVGEKKAKSLENLASNKITRPPAQATKNVGTKRSTSSIFYVDTNSEESIKPGKLGQITYSKTSDDEAVKFKPAPRKTKAKTDQQKKTAEIHTSGNHTQAEPPASKPKPVKLKPTIITAKKPKDTVTKELQEPPSLSLPNPVQIPVDETPPIQPDIPPIVGGPEETQQPQRPKAPPNAGEDGQKNSVHKKTERQKDSKNIQKKSKPKPPRPPLSKDGVKNRPTRAAPAKPTVGRTPNATKKVRQPPPSKPEEEKPKPSGPARAIATFDYSSDANDDLSFKVGDTIMLISKVDDDWFVGYVESNVMHQGLFPSSFVDVIVPLNERLNEKVQEHVTSEPYAVALHDFQGQSSEELSFSTDQTIILIERINQEWLKGKLNNTVGIFPQKFVRVERDLPNQDNLILKNNEVKNQQPISVEWCRAVHDYQGSHDDDLSFVVGDEIKITERLEKGWLRGVLLGKVGIFPASFIDIISRGTQNSQDSIFVVAVHDYSGENAEDLRFKTGDKIRLVERINADWLLGELNGKEGLFPKSFVDDVPEILPNRSNVSKSDMEQSRNARFAKAVHDFTGENEGELRFRAGDLIEVLREIDSNWCEGAVNGVSGIFPVAFVEMNPSKPQSMPCVKALHDFESGNPDDLSFKAGEVIQLAEKLNEDWWTGSVRGKTGQFPATFVEVVNTS